MMDKTDVDRRPIAIVDYVVNEQSPSGSCHLRILEALCGEIDFTVFATEFDNPDPARIGWVPVPCFFRPLAARYVSFYAASALALRRHTKRGGLVQAVESCTYRQDMAYVHFCHRAFLRHHWREARPTGIRRFSQYVNHHLRAAGEGRAVRRASTVVVPSQTLALELHAEHGVDMDRVRVIPNPVAVDRFYRPSDSHREELRGGLGVAQSDLLVVFVALGHFERKGLPELLSALTMTAATVRLVVVGGKDDLVRAYRNRVTRLGLTGRVEFVGQQPDVRPFLWAADVFAAPSAYEVFPLATLQAAAAGLPLVVTPLDAVASFFEDGRNGIAVSRDGGDIANALSRLDAGEAAWRLELGAAARRAAAQFDAPHFAARWRDLYRELGILEVAPDTVERRAPAGPIG
jgi:glycosyltransferase involved in cell wall biosynthesis